MSHLLSLLLLLPAFSAFALERNSQQELTLLYEKFDRDDDKKITIDDKISAKEAFNWNDKPVKGTYFLSNLAQELKLAIDTSSEVNHLLIFENPVDRISRSIRERYWGGLTRRIDATSLESVIKDSKVDAEELYLYVPTNDPAAFKYFTDLKLKNISVVKLPESIPEGFITSLGKKQGLLSLKLVEGKGVPYVVPGGRFNEMYGWDSYFHVLGTLSDQKPDLARGMVDNFVYEIQHYHKILNANRTYYLSRSQPPFLTSMISAVYESMGKDKNSKAWLKESLLAAIKEYETVWMGRDRLTSLGLSRYAGFDQGIPPEVEPGHFDHILIPYAKKHGLPVSELILKFNNNEIKDQELIDFFHHDRAVRESGHDTTYRWRVGSDDRAADFVTVDLNSLLYKFEQDIAHLLNKEFNGKLDKHSSKRFVHAARKRKDLIRRYLWNSKAGLFFDYNWRTKTQSTYVSATTLYPLWAGDLLAKDEAKRLVKNALDKLEAPGGIAATSQDSLKSVEGIKEERQWDYPNGWAPHQMIAWKGLLNYGFEKEAHRLAYKWLYMITKNAMDYHGTIPEKYDVVTRSHKVFAEYGNVGTKFSYITKEGFGWMNASYQIGLKMLPGELELKLKALTPPEELYHQPKPLR